MVLVLGLDQRVPSFPFPLLLTSPLGSKGTPESTLCFMPLYTPFLGAPQEDGCVNSVGQCPQDSAHPCHLPPSSSHSSRSPKTKGKNRWTVEGFHPGHHNSGRAVVGKPWLSSICPVARALQDTCICHLPFELPDIQLQQNGFKS